MFVIFASTPLKVRPLNKFEFTLAAVISDIAVNCVTVAVLAVKEPLIIAVSPLKVSAKT